MKWKCFYFYFSFYGKKNFVFNSIVPRSINSGVLLFKFFFYIFLLHYVVIVVACCYFYLRCFFVIHICCLSCCCCCCSGFCFNFFWWNTLQKIYITFMFYIYIYIRTHWTFDEDYKVWMDKLLVSTI